MSKADQLGVGRFGGTTRTISARRQAVAAATGVPTDGVAPPTELPTHKISPNPDNPRSSLGDLTDLAGSLSTHGQKQAITVMNRDAYLKANPDREADLEPNTTHVVIDGSSRLAAAREAGLTSIKVMVSDDQGTTSEEILESALVANIHRQDLEELDEARALQRLLSIHGSQTALARRLHRSQGWVSQRLALLNLTPQLQARVGEEPIDLLRAVGNKPAEQQQAALDELKAERARKEAEKQERHLRNRQQKTQSEPRAAVQPEAPARRAEAAAEDAPADVQDHARNQADASSYYDVMADAPKPDHTSAPAAMGEASAPASAGAVPEPRTDGEVNGEDLAAAQKPSLPKLPYDDGVFVAMHLIRKMSDTEFDRMLSVLMKHQQRRETLPGSEL
ncbi:ParB/RepB/Spo0J family partition protein [Streptomyces sp. NPDC005728]|uniref:ParB/RepB/Spo0J family partition protein n=1 Tax=Streptomyces sp. NPDC005728 TaxID=3157054 RepID=UPI00340A7A13